MTSFLSSALYHGKKVRRTNLMAETTNIVLVCDESGAKGYADQQESYPGEVGVFAGILVPEERKAVARTAFQAIYDRYQPVTGKLHIADLAPASQSNLRNDIYEKVNSIVAKTTAEFKSQARGVRAARA